MVNESQSPVPLEPPRGTYPARVDDKGRLKLPANFQAYLASLPEQKVFVTSLDKVTARIYPIAVWRANESLLENYTKNPKAAVRVLRVANHLGSDCEMYGQGRILLSPELRRALGLENQPVRLGFLRGAIDVFSEAEYERSMLEAGEGLQANLDELQFAGMK